MRNRIIPPLWSRHNAANGADRDHDQLEARRSVVRQDQSVLLQAFGLNSPCLWHPATVTRFAPGVFLATLDPFHQSLVPVYD